MDDGPLGVAPDVLSIAGPCLLVGINRLGGHVDGEAAVADEVEHTVVQLGRRSALTAHGLQTAVLEGAGIDGRHGSGDGNLLQLRAAVESPAADVLHRGGELDVAQVFAA